MRKVEIIITFLFIVMLCPVIHGQDVNVDSVKIYAIKWNGKYPFARNPEGLKKFPKFYFETNGSRLNTFFIDYDDCIKKLQNEKNQIKEGGFLVSLVILVFSDKKQAEISFDSDGNYFTNGKWYKVNNELYYTLFKYFSNEIISEKTLKGCKEKYRGDFWYD